MARGFFQQYSASYLEFEMRHLLATWELLQSLLQKIMTTKREKQKKYKLLSILILINLKDE